MHIMNMLPKRINVGMLMVMFTLTAIIVAYFILSQRSDEVLLERIALVQPGMKLDSIKNRLGDEFQVVTDPDYMIHIGRIQDRSFCEGKKASSFPSCVFRGRAFGLYRSKRHGCLCDVDTGMSRKSAEADPSTSSG
jgi:hypothetical protein